MTACTVRHKPAAESPPGLWCLCGFRMLRRGDLPGCISRLRCDMAATIVKVLLSASDAQGRDVQLARFDDGLWRIVLDDQPQGTSWPYRQLSAAVRAYWERLHKPPRNLSAKH